MATARALMVMPRSRSSSMSSRSCSFIWRFSTVPVSSTRRSASVDFPWSTWAMMLKLRIRRVSVTGGGWGCGGRVAGTGSVRTPGGGRQRLGGEQGSGRRGRGAGGGWERRRGGLGGCERTAARAGVPRWKATLRGAGWRGDDGEPGDRRSSATVAAIEARDEGPSPATTAVRRQHAKRRARPCPQEPQGDRRRRVRRPSEPCPDLMRLPSEVVIAGAPFMPSRVPRRRRRPCPLRRRAPSRRF